MKEIKILIGFKTLLPSQAVEQEEKLAIQLKALGYLPSFYRRDKKKEVEEFLKEHKDCRSVLLTETIGMGSYSENELAELVDERDLNLVVILHAKHKQELQYMTTLYAAGITSAFFQKGNEGPNFKELAVALVQPRTRKAAREYYGINTKSMSIRSLTYEMYTSYLATLLEEDLYETPMNRLLHIAEKLNPYQMDNFLTRLPADTLKPLMEYAEFGQLIDELRKCGIKARYYRKPRKFRHMDDDLSYQAYAEKQRKLLQEEEAGEEMPSQDTLEKPEELPPAKEDVSETAKKVMKTEETENAEEKPKAAGERKEKPTEESGEGSFGENDGEMESAVQSLEDLFGL